MVELFLGPNRVHFPREPKFRTSKFAYVSIFSYHSNQKIFFEIFKKFMYHSKEHEKLIKKNITTYIRKWIYWEILRKISKMTSQKVTSSNIKTSQKSKNFYSILRRTFQGTKNIITKRYETEVTSPHKAKQIHEI